MPYANNNIISQDPIEGGITISEAQYKEALQGMLGGLGVTIVDGAIVLVVPHPQETE